MLDCTQFPEGTRLRSICDGTSDLPAEVVQQYRDLWTGQPPRPALACVHRGEEISQVQCPSCGDRKVMVKVFGCALHAQCTIAKPIGAIKTCEGCGSRLEKHAEVA